MGSPLTGTTRGQSSRAPAGDPSKVWAQASNLRPPAQQQSRGAGLRSRRDPQRAGEAKRPVHGGRDQGHFPATMHLQGQNHSCLWDPGPHGSQEVGEEWPRMGRQNQAELPLSSSQVEWALRRRSGGVASMLLGPCRRNLADKGPWRCSQVSAPMRPLEARCGQDRGRLAWDHFLPPASEFLMLMEMMLLYTGRWVLSARPCRALSDHPLLLHEPLLNGSTSPHPPRTPATVTVTGWGHRARGAM